MNARRAYRKFEQASYDKWHASLPWSDEQLAQALEIEAKECPIEVKSHWYTIMAKRCRNGYVSRATIRFLLPRLITTCYICGKKALYRQGREGRCREHKMILSDGVKAHHARLEAKSSDYEKTSRLDSLGEARRRHALKICRKFNPHQQNA